MEASAVAAEDKLPFAEQPRLHVKNTFIEVDGDSDDSLDMDSWMRASTEPAKVFQQFKGQTQRKARRAGEARSSTKEPQYVYTQQAGNVEPSAREASWPALESSSQEGLRILEADPELAPIFERLKQGGVEAASQLCKDASLMQKISRKMDELKLANFLSLVQLHPAAQDETMDLSGLVSALTVMEEAVVQQVTLGAIRTMPCSVTLADPSLDDCPLIGCSEGFEALTGYTSKEIVGKNCRFLNAGVNMDPAMRLAIRDCISHGSEFIGVLPNLRKNGEQFSNLLRMTSTNVRGKRYIIGVQADVSNIQIDPHDPIHIEELRATARLIFSSNIEAWIQMQARQYYIRQPVPFAEMLKADSPQEQQSMGKFVVINPPAEEGPSEDVAVNKSCKAPPSAAGSSPVDHTTQLSEQSTCVGGEHTEDQESADGSGATATPEPLRSIGSAGHPDSCASECIFYFFRDGCRAAENCRFCHEFHPRKNMKKNRRILRRLCTEGTGGNNEGETEELLEEPRPSPTGSSTKAAKGKVAAAQEALAAPVMHDGPALAGGVRYWYGPERPGSATQKLTLVMDQTVHLPAHVEVAAEQRQELQECLNFSIQPALPAGLTLDSSTGHISGTPEEESATSLYTFTASIAATGPNGIDLGQVHLASCRFEISVVDLHRFRLFWGHADESGANLTLQLQPELCQ